MRPSSASGPFTALGAQTMRALNAPAPEFLVLTNIDLDALPPDTLRFGIFAGKPPVGTASGSTNTFLGMASRVLSEGHAHAEPLSAALDISNKLGSLDPDGGAAALDLHVAPLDETKTTTGEAIPVAADSIRIVG